MKLIRLTDGRDIVDMRGYPNFPTLAEDTEGKFVFHALNSVSPKTTAEKRGVPVLVSEVRAEELLTHPTAFFEEVTAEQAEQDRYRRTLTPDMFGNLRDPRTGLVVGKGVPSALLAALPVELPPVGEPATPEDVRASVAKTLAAEKALAEEITEAPPAPTPKPKDTAK